MTMLSEISNPSVNNAMFNLEDRITQASSLVILPLPKTFFLASDGVYVKKEFILFSETHNSAIPRTLDNDFNVNTFLQNVSSTQTVEGVNCVIKSFID